MDEAAQQRRVEALLRRLANPERRWRWQSTLQLLGELWARTRWRSCLAGGSSLWPKVAPTAEGIRTVGRCLDDPRPDVRIAVMFALRDATPHMDEALPFLAAGLRDPYVPVRLNAINAIRGRVHWAGPIAPALRAALKDPVFSVRTVAAVTLSFIEPSEELVPMLVELMEKDVRWMDPEAVTALRRLGALARPAVPTLLQLLERGTTYFDKALDTLHAIVGDTDVPGLSRARFQRLQEAARMLGSASLEEARSLTPLLASEDPVIRVHAVGRVCAYGRQVRDLNERLLELLEDPSPFVRAEVAAYVTQRELMTPEALRPWLARQPAEGTRHLVAALWTGRGYSEAMLRELARSDDAPTRTQAERYLAGRGSLLVT